MKSTFYILLSMFKGLFFNLHFLITVTSAITYIPFLSISAGVRHLERKGGFRKWFRIWYYHLYLLRLVLSAIYLVLQYGLWSAKYHFTLPQGRREGWASRTASPNSNKGDHFTPDVFCSVHTAQFRRHNPDDCPHSQIANSQVLKNKVFFFFTV